MPEIVYSKSEKCIFKFRNVFFEPIKSVIEKFRVKLILSLKNNSNTKIVEHYITNHPNLHITLLNLNKNK